jgi:hypothetical protein
MEKTIENQVLEYLKMYDILSGTNKVGEWNNLSEEEKDDKTNSANIKAKVFVEKSQPIINNFFNSLFKEQ